MNQHNTTNTKKDKVSPCKNTTIDQNKNSIKKSLLAQNKQSLTYQIGSSFTCPYRGSLISLISSVLMIKYWKNKELRKEYFGIIKQNLIPILESTLLMPFLCIASHYAFKKLSSKILSNKINAYKTLISALMMIFFMVALCVFLKRFKFRGKTLVKCCVDSPFVFKASEVKDSQNLSPIEIRKLSESNKELIEKPEKMGLLIRVILTPLFFTLSILRLIDVALFCVVAFIRRLLFDLLSYFTSEKTKKYEQKIFFDSMKHVGFIFYKDITVYSNFFNISEKFDYSHTDTKSNSTYLNFDTNYYINKEKITDFDQGEPSRELHFIIDKNQKTQMYEEML